MIKQLSTVKRKENNTEGQSYMTKTAAIMEIALGAKEIVSINSEIKNRMMKKQIGRNDIWITNM